MNRQWIAAVVLASVPVGLSAEEPVVNRATVPSPVPSPVIVGNQEQPRVLYLLPWQDADLRGDTLNLWRRQSYGVFDHESPRIWQSSWRAQRKSADANASTDRPDESCLGRD